ncbi:YaaL family protein [Weissella bombi]|uniref:DUF2508 domain-containing protein n=1 Tax=Weissella bombi TaxID=1505725 RepID=A0A1C4B2P6_9LACO|nr:YaaL family protein [Weissella bombi]SCC01008.1 Protein of unknown function [Weissella bombi]
MFKLRSKRPKFDAKAYDERLNQAIERAKYDYEKARISEDAMFESNIAPNMIKAETARAKQKYFFLLRAARERGMKGHWSTAFVHPEK